MTSHPSIVAVTRGRRVESIHRGSVAVVDCRRTVGCAALVSLGLGIAIKIDDSAGRLCPTEPLSS